MTEIDRRKLLVGAAATAAAAVIPAIPAAVEWATVPFQAVGGLIAVWYVGRDDDVAIQTVARRMPDGAWKVVSRKEVPKDQLP